MATSPASRKNRASPARAKGKTGGPLREPMWNSVASKWQVSITYTVHWLGSICHGSPGREVSTPTMVARPTPEYGVLKIHWEKKKAVII